MGKLHDALKKSTPKAPAPRGGSSQASASAAAQVAEAPSKGPAAAGASGATPAAAASSAPIYVPSAMRGDVDAHLVPVADPRSEIADQYRTLRTNLLAVAKENNWKAFVVTSAVAGEGKSITAANLACSLAEQSDRKVVLLDADLRTPTQHTLLAVDNQRGLSDYLAGGSMLEMALQRSRLSNLWVLPAGRTPANPAELLAGKRLDDLVARLRRDYDYVVIDTPPVVTATDAAVLAPRADGTLLVVRMEQTQRDVVKHALELLKKARANVLGTVLTALPAAKGDTAPARRSA